MRRERSPDLRRTSNNNEESRHTSAPAKIVAKYTDCMNFLNIVLHPPISGHKNNLLFSILVIMTPSFCNYGTLPIRVLLSFASFGCRVGAGFAKVRWDAFLHLVIRKSLMRRPADCGNRSDNNSLSIGIRDLKNGYLLVL